MDRLIVNCIKNPYEPLPSREIKEFPVRTSLSDCLKYFYKNPEIYDYVVNINGTILPDVSFLDKTPLNGSVIICAYPQGGGDSGKSILRVVAMIAIAVAAAYSGGAAATAYGWTGGTMTMGQSVAYAAASMAVSVAGSLLVNALFPVAGVDLGGQGNFSESSTYGWDASGANADKEGVAWPVLHGTHRISPPIIGKYIEVVGDKQWLNILYAVADHKIDSIDEDSIQINGNPVVKGEDATWDIRLGDINQSCIQYFGDTRTLKTVSIKVSDEWTSVVTDGLSVEGLGISLTMPKGLYYAANDGSLTVQSVGVDIEVRKLPAGDWQPLQAYNTVTTTISSDRWSGGYWVTGEFGEHLYWIDVVQGSTIPGDHLEGDSCPNTGVWYGPIVDGGDWNPNWRAVYEWHWVENADTVYQIGEIELDYVQITGAQSNSIRRTYYRDRLEAGEYEIRMRFHDGVLPPSDVRYANDVWFDYIEEIIYDDFTYPGTALFAIRALATDKLSGGIPAVSFIATRSKVNVWDGTQYVEKAANNPAWKTYDDLHNKDYGGGLSYDRLIYEDFSLWADYCDSKGYHCNMYGDSITNLRKILDINGMLGEGSVSQVGAKMTSYIDGEVALPVQSFIFNAGNVIRDTYKEEYLAMDDRANAIDVTFWDEDNDYKSSFFSLQIPNLEETDQEIKRASLQLVGCTALEEAVKHGWRALNRNLYLTRTASWDVGIDAIGCLPWDPVIPPTGSDGRVVSGTNTTVVLDKEVALLPGITYYIRVKNSLDDAIEEKAVEAVSEETITDSLTIVGAWTHVPLQYELYIFYEEGQDLEMMRVVQISRKDDFTRTITAVEYSENAISDSGDVPEPVVYTPPIYVDFLRAEEVWKGGAETIVQLSWRGFALLWRVWYRKTLYTDWIYTGETTDSFFSLRGLDYGIGYTFCVSHTRNPDDGKTITLTLSGKTTPPGNISSVSAVPWEDGATFSWAKVTDFDLIGYKVRTGVNWRALNDYTGMAGDFYVVPTDASEKRFKLTVPGTSGGTEPVWPESGSITDGSCIWTIDADANWLWENIADSNYQRALTNDEQIVQGKNATTITIWAVARDAFDNVSETAATKSVACLNQKPYITVGVTSVEGTFADLPAAVAKLPSGGGRIIIKNGTYTASGAISLPDKILDIEGETQDGVILKNANNTDLFVLHNLTKKQTFSKFTIQSNSTAYTNEPRMFYLYGDTYSQFTARVAIKNITLNLGRKVTDRYEGDYGVYVDSCSGEDIIFSDCLVNGGYIAMMAYADVYSVLRVSDNIITSSTRGLHGNPKNEAFYVRNVMKSLTDIGLWLPGGSGKLNILQNKISFANDFNLGSGTIVGMQIDGNSDHSKVEANEIVIAYNIGDYTHIYGMSLKGQYMQVLNNQINISGSPLNPLGTRTLIYWTSSNNGEITNNTGVFNATNVAGKGFDIASGNDNRIDGNVLSAVDAGGAGITLGETTQGNSGINTITGGWSTKISDEGDNNNNAVNKFFGGTF